MAWCEQHGELNQKAVFLSATREGTISFPEPMCLLVSTKTRSSGIINKLVPRSEPTRLFLLNFDTTVLSKPDSFSSPEAALLLVSTKNRDLWPCPTPEVRDSRTSRHSAHVQSQV